MTDEITIDLYEDGFADGSAQKLVALLKRAGALKVRIQRPRGRDCYYISALPGETVPQSVVENGHLDDGYIWLLSARGVGRE